MTEVLGPQTILSRALPTGVDATELAKWSLRRGYTWQDAMGEIATALGEFNQRFQAKWGWLYSITSDLMVEYPNGGTVTRAPAITDVSKIDLIHGTTLGHMIDLKPYGLGMGGTWRFFRDARPAQIEAMVKTLIQTHADRMEYELVNRLFIDDEVAVGSAGYNVGFVTSSGSVVYTPPQYDGLPFSGHSHYVGYNLSTPLTRADMLDGLAQHLAEHGHTAPFDAVVSYADRSAYRALANFVDYTAPVVNIVERGGATTGPAFYGQYNPVVTADGILGYYQSPAGVVQVRASGRVPTAYAAMVKSYGNNDPRNALRIRVHPDQGFGLFISSERSANSSADFPINKMTIENEFGVSVGSDRTAGVVGYLVAGGSYADATIS